MGGRSRLITSFTGSMIRCHRGIRGASNDLSASDARILKLLSVAQVASESRLQMAQEASESRLQMAQEASESRLQMALFGLTISLGALHYTVRRNMVHQN